MNTSEGTVITGQVTEGHLVPTARPQSSYTVQRGNDVENLTMAKKEDETGGKVEAFSVLYEASDKVVINEADGRVIRRDGEGHEPLVLRRTTSVTLVLSFLKKNHSSNMTTGAAGKAADSFHDSRLALTRSPLKKEEENSTELRLRPRSLSNSSQAS